MNLVILGGGIGGQVVANELRRFTDSQHRVTPIAASAWRGAPS
jgi:NADH dehydrogenase FAD-containing subunit